MRRGPTILLLSFLGFLLAATPASANVTVLSNSPSYSAGPLTFYCQPYVAGFEANKHYVPADSPCVFSMPSSVGGQKIIAVYKGVPGNASLVASDFVSNTSATLVQEDLVTFGILPQDQDLFAVVWNFSSFGGTGGALGKALASSSFPYPAGAVLGQNYYLIPWKWGSKPQSEFDPVIIIPGILGSWEKNGEWVIDPILHTYDNLVDTFLANGYVKDQTLFTFGYDWKSPNEITAAILAQKIQDIKGSCNCNKVDVIAHSMGGLVALYYAESTSYQNDIDQLFLVATPLMGAPNAYKTWEGGEVELDNVIRNIFIRTKFRLEARREGFNSIFDYIRNRPIESIHELLPASYDYLFDSSFSPLPRPINGFTEELLLGFAGVYKKIRIGPVLANNGLDNTPVGFFVASSTELPKWEHGKPTQTLVGPGDGTVPHYPLLDMFGDSAKMFEGVDHTEVASTSSSYVFKELNLKDPEIIVGKLYSTGLKALIITLFSPLDMQIIAPDGKRLGKDFATNTEVNELPDAFYSGFGTENEYAIIVDPLPGNYAVKTTGSGSGAYAIIANYITEATTTMSEVVGTTTLAELIGHTLTLSSTSTNINITKDVPPPPPAPALTPDTCLVDMAKAYQNKWIKRNVYEGMTFDCKTLGMLFKTRDEVEKIDPTKRARAQEAILYATLLRIKLTLRHMELFANSKGNTKEGVELVTKYTTWFKEHELAD